MIRAAQGTAHRAQGRAERPTANLCRCWWAIVRSGAIAEEDARGRAAAVVGRPMEPGFGLSTLSKVEWIRVVDDLKRAVGQEVGEHRSGPGRSGVRGYEGTRVREDGTGGVRERPNARTLVPSNVVRIASLDQHQLVRALQDEMHLSEDELAGIARQATGKTAPKTMLDLTKLLNALQAIRRRRMVAAANDAQGTGHSAQRTGHREGAA